MDTRLVHGADEIVYEAEMLGGWVTGATPIRFGDGVRSPEYT
ncbi:MAG: hypothetical protein ABIR32_10810 [Ilumatobacteraceae bacterium]